MIEVYAVKKNYILQESILDKLILYLPENKQNMIKKFRRLEDAQNAIIGDILVRINILEKLSLKNKEIVFEKNEFGKPFLKGFNNFHFNISHSGQWIVCALHDFPIGIDIEAIKQINLKVAKRFYSKHEYNELLKRDSSKRAAYFFDLWTLRESYVKAVGKGLSIPLSSFSFRLCDDSRIELVTESESGDYYFKQYNIDENYKMAVCSCIDAFPEDVAFKEIDEIYDRMLVMGG